MLIICDFLFEFGSLIGSLTFCEGYYATEVSIGQSSIAQLLLYLLQVMLLGSSMQLRLPVLVE